MARDDEQLLRTSSFRVLIDGRELGFAEITQLTSLTTPEPGGERRHGFDTVVLRRALTRSTELYDWRRRIAGGAHDRRTVTIQQLSTPGGDIANSWRLDGAWPRRWSGPAFNAQGSDVAMEELELAFDDLVWLGEHEQGG
jgi:phage tail-like protein